jgi:hypothetical protein
VTEADLHGRSWPSINMRGNQTGSSQAGPEAELRGDTTHTWFGSIVMGSQLTDRHTPPRPSTSQHTTSTDNSPDKFFRDYCQQSEDEHDVRGQSLPTFPFFRFFRQSEPNRQLPSAVLLTEHTAEAQPLLLQPPLHFRHCRKRLPHVPF